MVSTHRGIGEWALLALGIIFILLGLVFFAGGAWLAVLGGSLYYLLAGVGLTASGVLLIMVKPLGAWLYMLIFFLTVIWALWEVGLDGWALVPRIVGPAILFLILLFFIPMLHRRSGREAPRP